MSNRSSWFDHAVGACLALLVGAAALYIAVQLIEAVATALIVIVSVVFLAALTAVAIRRRFDRW